MKPIWWIIIIAVLALIVIWIIARAASRKKAEADRVHAEEMRSQADVHDRELRERQAAADEADAKARKAQAEADESNARARQLQAEAERRGEAAHEVRTNRDETLREADALDPDVRTDKDGYRLDESGNRIEDRRDGLGAGATGAGAAAADDGMWTDRRDRDGTDGADWRDGDTSTDRAGTLSSSSADRDGDGDVGLDDRVENKVDESVGHDDPTRNDLGDRQDDATLDGEDRALGNRSRDRVEDFSRADVDGDGRRG